MPNINKTVIGSAIKKNGTGNPSNCTKSTKGTTWILLSGSGDRGLSLSKAIQASRFPAKGILWCC